MPLGFLTCPFYMGRIHATKKCIQGMEVAGETGVTWQHDNDLLMHCDLSFPCSDALSLLSNQNLAESAFI